MLDLHCSAQTAELGEAVAGTANGSECWVLAELPGPWPKPIKSHPELAGLDWGAIDAAGARVLAIADETTSADSPTRRIIRYERRGRPLTAGPFVGTEAQVDSATLCESICAAAARSLDTAPLAEFTRDVLVCTQGSHDRCCGRFGTQLYTDLHERYHESAAVRVWKTSHTGGHRFAPTGITFPDGLAWAGMDLDLVAEVVSRTGDGTSASARLRGSVAIGDKAAQVADAAAARCFGWIWLDSERSWTRSDGDGAVLTLDGPATVRVRVEPGRTLPVPLCGLDLEQAAKTTTELIAVEVDERCDEY